MAPAVPGELMQLPVGSVIEQRQDDRTFLVVQEAPDRTAIIESWDDGLDLIARLLGQVNQSLELMIADNAVFIEQLAAGLDETGAKIAANQRLLDSLIKGSP